MAERVHPPSDDLAQSRPVAGRTGPEAVGAIAARVLATAPRTGQGALPEAGGLSAQSEPRDVQRVRDGHRSSVAGAVMTEPCRCGECVRAGVNAPSLTIPGFRSVPPQELHGVALRDHLAAQDRLRATIAKLKGESAR